MARKKNPESPKIVELPQHAKKIFSSDDWLEIARQAQELAQHSAQVEILARVAKNALNYSDIVFDDFVTAIKLRDIQQEQFLETIKKILNP